MATVNLGRIKPVFRGAYAGGTAYVVDDIVTHGNETFICIQAGTGNATSNASYWTKLAAKGTDGTDVGTTLTTQGDILYRDGSGLQRLGAGTSGQVLQTGGAGANPSWTTMSSDVVKLATQQSDDVNASIITFQNLFDHSLYNSYVMNWCMSADGGIDFKVRYLDGNNSELSGSNDYRRAGAQSYRFLDNSGDAIGTWSDADGTNAIHLTGWNASGDTNQTQGGVMEMQIPKPNVSSIHKNAFVRSGGYSTGNYFFQSAGTWVYTGGNAVSGIKIYVNSNQIHRAYVTIYGLKK